MRSQHWPTDGTLPLLAFYFFIGVALLAKGLIGIVFPFAIVGVLLRSVVEIADGRLSSA